MHIDIDVEDALVEPEKLDNAKYDIYEIIVSLQPTARKRNMLLCLGARSTPNRIPTIDITESRCLALLRVMQPTRPIDSDITLASVETGCTFHATTCADTTELEEAIEHGTVVADIVF